MNEMTRGTKVLLAEMGSAAASFYAAGCIIEVQLYAGP
jgi:hypothetical protein